MSTIIVADFTRGECATTEEYSDFTVTYYTPKDNAVLLAMALNLARKGWKYVQELKEDSAGSHYTARIILTKDR